MVEVVVRNAMDRALQDMARTRGWSSWFDGAPLDQRGRADVRKARERATRFGTQPEVHGKVVAELTRGFWHYLAAYRDRHTITSRNPLGPKPTTDTQRVDRARALVALRQARDAAHSNIQHRRATGRHGIGI